MHKIKSSANKIYHAAFNLDVPMLSCEIALASASEPVLNQSSLCGAWSCFWSWRKHFELQSVMLVARLSCVVFIVLWHGCLSLICCGFLLQTGVDSILVFLCPSFNGHTIVTVSPVNVLVHIYSFDSLEVSLHSRDKSHEAVGNESFTILPNSGWEQFLSEYVYIHWDTDHTFSF